MRISEAFRRFGVELPTPAWTSSAVSEEPKQVILSLWEHAFLDGKARYVSGTAGWTGGGKSIFYKHLNLAMDEHLPIRVVIASTDFPEEIAKGNATRTDNDFEPIFELVGRVVRLEENEIELAFERTGIVPPQEIEHRAKTGVKYWHVADAVDSLGKPSKTTEIRAWLKEHYPDEDHSDLIYNLSLLTVNDTNRRHYDRSRKDWRTDQKHARDRLFRIGTRRATTYESYDPSLQGHWNLLADANGVWEAVPLPLSVLDEAILQAQTEAFAHPPALITDLDSRVWTQTAIALRQGQSGFRTMMLNAYRRCCAITGSNATAVLEAAHILPYRGEHTHRVDNGLLLRSDFHTLFDLGLLWITPDNAVAVADELRDTEYWAFAGKPLLLPDAPSDHPNPAHLAEHARVARERRGVEP